MLKALTQNRFFLLFQKINPQLFQTFAIGNLLLIGGKYYGFVDISWLEMLVVVASCLATDYAFKHLKNGEHKIPYSALNTAIGICLFLRTNVLPIYIFASVLAIFSKYLIEIKGRHFFNPSYTAIFVCIMLFPITAYVNPLQWREGSWAAVAAITFLGSIVMLRVGTFAIVLGYFLSFFTWIKLFTTHSWDDIKILFFSGSFFILTFHGLTDPAIIPKKNLHRFLYVLQISTLFFVFRLFINENYSFFMAYFVVSLLEILFWHLEKIKLRTVVQVSLTTVFLATMINSSYNHTQQYNGVWPELLTNRCIKPVCDIREFKDNLELLTPFFWFEKS